MVLCKYTKLILNNGIQKLEWFKIDKIMEMIKKEPSKLKGDLLPVLKRCVSKTIDGFINSEEVT